jgi:trans-aconitate methyltransferase
MTVNSLHSTQRTCQEFEEAYLLVRAREGWLFNDDDLRHLPVSGYPEAQRKIWSWRRHSLARLVRHMRRVSRQGSFSVLDLGCGNGWMSHYLSEKFPNAKILGIDINRQELEQAQRVFQRDNLQFRSFDLLSDALLPERFDFVVIAGVIQYFPNLQAIQARLIQHLLPGGEIHVIDSNFYKNEELRTKARIASQNYFQQQGSSTMGGFYHHHLQSDWNGSDLNTSTLVRLMQTFGVISPFPWMFFKKAI